MLEFKCQRCGATKTEPLKNVVEQSPEHYDYLHNMRTPNEWSDNFYGWLLCPECTKKLRDFMTMKEGEV